jgi:hypothetical protein
MRHIIPISGKDSLATAIIQKERQPELDYEYIYNDTRMELPDTYNWISKVENELGISIYRTGKDLAAIIFEQKILPSPKRRYCTKLSKIFPMNDYIGKDEATVYLGIRADEDRPGGKESKNILMRYPLKEMGVNLSLVYRIVEGKNLMPPSFFWKRIYDLVVSEMRDGAWIVNELPRWVFDRTFAWRSRPNCYMCFYQRQYEWCGLLEFYPELFSEAERMEDEVGYETDTRSSKFFWIGQDKPLSFIRENFDRIVQARVNKICSTLSKHLQKDMFSDDLYDQLDLAQTSCGIYCGK